MGGEHAGTTRVGRRRRRRLLSRVASFRQKMALSNDYERELETPILKKARYDAEWDESNDEAFESVSFTILLR